MRKTISLVVSFFLPFLALAQAVDTTAAPTLLTLEDALRIALSENVSVKVADREVERTGYARKGTYSALFPQINGSASYQRTIKKQVMYMDGGGFDMSSMMAETMATYLLPLYAQHPDVPFPTPAAPSEEESSSSNEGFSVGRWNTWSAGINASMPLVNAQLWKTLRISDQDVELAVEKARSSRLETVNQVKQAFFACLLAREAFEVYKSAYENALENCNQIQRRYNAQKASELDLTRAKTTLANAIPNVYDAESSMILSLWQLKAVMGVDLEENFDVAGSLGDYAQHMLYDLHESGELSLENNSSLRQLALQAEQLANAIKVQQYAALPTLSLSFNYSLNAMANDFKFSEYRWSPYSFVGLNLSIPIFAGGQRLNAVRQARVQAGELDLQRANTERQLKIAIRQYLNQMETAMKSYASAESAAGTAQKAYDIASKSYDVGRSTLTDLNDAQLALTQARLGVSQAVFNFVVAKANLESTLGADFIDAGGNVQLNKTYIHE
ncbi:MAG: TolC family protein [Bacteroidales bacterium]|nr:TolC family protein [Bacteroidales bacterium]